MCDYTREIKLFSNKVEGQTYTVSDDEHRRAYQDFLKFVPNEKIVAYISHLNIDRHTIITNYGRVGIFCQHNVNKTQLLFTSVALNFWISPLYIELVNVYAKHINCGETINLLKWIKHTQNTTQLLSTQRKLQCDINELLKEELTTNNMNKIERLLTQKIELEKKMCKIML